MVIKTKIIAIIAITILISVGVTTGILIHIQRSQMEEHASKEGELITDVIHRSIDHAMLLGRTREVQSIIENLGKNEELIAVRILSLRGEILKSSEPSEIGLKAADFSSGAAPAGRVIKTNDKDILVFSKPIDNKQTCFSCHGHKEKINGIIQIEQDLSRNSATLASLKEILLSSNIALVILVSALLSVLFTKFVTKPLKGLLLTIKDIEAGNWDATVTVRSNDELGLIGSSFNAMIREMKALYKKDVTKERELANIRIKLEHKTKVEELNTQLEYKLQELETANKAISSLSKEVKGKNLQLEKAIERLKKINEVGTTLTSIIETAELMKIIIRSTADLIKADRITMHLNGKKRTPLTLQYQRGLGIDHLTDVSMEFNSTYSDILKRGKSIHHSEAPGNQATDLSGSIARIGVPLKMQGQIIGALVLENNNGGVRFTEDELELLTTIANQAMVAVENALLYETVKANYFAAIQSLINALEANDKFTKGHSERVTLLSLELARYIGLDYRELETLEHAAILHDIGKLGIDALILQKRGKLTADEYALVQAHPAIGNEILKPIQTLDNIRMIIIQHHERYDGKGYPNSLKGSEISLKSKILSVVDTFDAMMTDRPYRNALTMEEALDELKTHSGTQFDPYVVQMFIDMLKSKGDEFLASIGYDALQSVSYDSQ
jgi:HD-GYP domain-containing protein (c-di-GMP phosphodiesterase class II)